jgi:hypothetical protein
VDEVAVLSVLLLAGAAVLLLLVAVVVSVPAPSASRPSVRTGGSWLAGRVAGPWALAVTLGLVVLSRTAGANEIDNPVPALVVGLLWPALLVVPALLTAVLAGRAAVRDTHAVRDVCPAVTTAAAVVGYLTLAPRPTEPGRLGTALAVYAVVLLAVAVALGRDAAARTDALGLLPRWSALGPGLTRWHPPTGAAAVLVVVLGGAWAERAQRTAAWAEVAQGRTAQVALLLAGVAVAAAGAALLTRWSDGQAAPVLLPLAAAAVLAGVLRRALISVQLLWDSVGPGVPGLDADPLGITGGRAAALAVAAAGCALALAVLARRVGTGTARLPGIGVILALTAVTSAIVLAP